MRGLFSHRATEKEIEPGTSRPSVSRFSNLRQGVDISMLRQLVAGQGCTDDAGPSTSSNPLAGLFSHMLGTTKHNEYLHEVRTTIPTFSKIDQDKIRNRSHIHTRHLFPGAATTKWRFRPLSRCFAHCFVVSSVTLTQSNGNIRDPRDRVQA
jgi:hypothetical protein